MWQPYIAWQAGYEARGSSGPVVSDTAVFVKGGDVLYAYDRFSGQELWQYPIAGSESDMPAFQSGLVYVSTSYYGTGYLAAVNAATGTEEWRFQGQDLSAPASSPLVAGNTVFFMTVEQGTVNDPDTFLYALDPVTGEQRWRYEAEGLGGQPPAAGGGMVFILGEDDDIIAVDIATGEKRWEADSPHDAAPIYVEGGRLVLVGKDGVATVLLAEDGTQIWSREIYTGGPSSLGHASWPYAAVSQGVVYVTTPDEELLAVDSVTGRERWRVAPGVDLMGSPTVTSEAIYVGARGGFSQSDATTIPSVVAFSLDGAELWRLTINPYAEAWDIGLEVHEPIAVVDGMIYLAGFANNYGISIVALSG